MYALGHAGYLGQSPVNMRFVRIDRCHDQGGPLPGIQVPGFRDRSVPVPADFCDQGCCLRALFLESVRIGEEQLQRQKSYYQSFNRLAGLLDRELALDDVFREDFHRVADRKVVEVLD
jgi:hypothetical protein